MNSHRIQLGSGAQCRRKNCETQAREQAR